MCYNIYIQLIFQTCKYQLRVMISCISQHIITSAAGMAEATVDGTAADLGGATVAGRVRTTVPVANIAAAGAGGRKL